MGVAQIIEFAAFPCSSGAPAASVAAAAVAVGVPGLFLVGVARLPASTAARIAVVLAIATVTAAAASAVLLTHICM
jgi:hypothetical protein